jgi:F0F1-type ATP synthase assembly protein I
VTEQRETGQRSTIRSVAIASGFGCSIISLLVVAVGGGIWIDQRFDSGPLWTLVGIGLALASIVFEFVLLVRSSRGEARADSRRSPSTTVARPAPGWDDDE